MSGAGTAEADSVCRAVATRATPAVAAPDRIDAGAVDATMPRLAAGQTLDEVSLYDVGRTSGQAVLCVEGGPCYPAAALRLLDCTIGPAEAAAADATDVIHPLLPIRAAIAAPTLRRHDLETRLSSIGLSDAAAFGAADAAIRRPGSPCARTVDAALAGAARARRALLDGGICPD